MLRQGFRVGVGILIIFCLAVLTAMNVLPGYNLLTPAGQFLAGDTCLYFKKEQGTKRLVAEILGGQDYVCMKDENNKSKDTLVFMENRDRYGDAKENQDPLIGDVDHGLQESMSNRGAQTNRQARQNNVLVQHLKETWDVDYLWQNFYIVDSTTSVTKNMFPVRQMLEADMKMKKKKGKKQILIYHTHGASEDFSDSKRGKIEDSVIGVGDELCRELEKRGYGVYHDRNPYDRVGNKIDRSFAYNQSLDGITKIKKQNPDIEVMIDLHRDSVGKGKHTYTTIQGKKTAVVMFFNGMSRTRSGPISYLANSNLKQNLSFSLQMKCKAMEYYDGFTKPIYLKGYRYNLHLLQKSLLIELGNENNTVKEAKNAAAPLADTLDKVLSGDG